MFLSWGFEMLETFDQVVTTAQWANNIARPIAFESHGTQYLWERTWRTVLASASQTCKYLVQSYLNICTAAHLNVQSIFNMYVCSYGHTSCSELGHCHPGASRYPMTVAFWGLFLLVTTFGLIVCVPCLNDLKDLRAMRVEWKLVLSRLELVLYLPRKSKP